MGKKKKKKDFLSVKGRRFQVSAPLAPPGRQVFHAEASAKISQAGKGSTGSKWNRDKEDKESRVTRLMKTGHNKSAASEVIHLFSTLQ